MKRRSTRMSVLAAALAATTALTGVADHAAARDRPDTIDLPSGFAGEGVATGPGGTFYAGSRDDGRIARGDLRNGTSQVFVAHPLVPSATGLKADVRHGLLWVSGGGTGQAAVYDLATGAGVTSLALATGPSFINDVVVTRDAAYFTNSVTPVIYRVAVSPRGKVGATKPITLSGPAADYVDGFNLNGIDATSDGRTLFSVNSARGTLYTIDARTGASAQIDLGGASVPTGDGILLVGRDLLVLQNGSVPDVPNQIAVVRLSRHDTRGEIVDTITSRLFETATTLARSGSTLVAVNAQFLPPRIDPEPEVVLVRWHG
jgi:hypothetical protein